MKDTERPFGKTVHEVIAEIVAEYNYPVCFDFPVSHSKENYALKVGATYELKVTSKTVQLKEKWQQFNNIKNLETAISSL